MPKKGHWGWFNSSLSSVTETPSQLLPNKADEFEAECQDDWRRIYSVHKQTHKYVIRDHVDSAKCGVGSIRGVLPAHL